MKNIYVNIIESKSNIFVNIMTVKKKMIYQLSGGMLLKGRKRKSPLAGELVGKLIKKQLIILKVKQIGLIVKGPFSQIVRGVFRGLTFDKRKKPLFVFIEEQKGIAHNGVRLKKKRRL